MLFAAVLGYHNDAASTGANLSETALTPANVNAFDFQQLSSTPVDGTVYAQPLYVPGVNITTGGQAGTHNVVYVATEHDSLYAIDGDTGAILWQDSFLVPATELQSPGGTVTVTTIPEPEVSPYSVNIGPEIGITSTPAIDPSSGELFLTASTKQIVNGDTTRPHFVYTLYRVNIADGTYSGTVMGDTAYLPDGSYSDRTDVDPYVIGTGDGSITVDGQQRVYFNAMRELNRVALALAHGSVYIGFASHADENPYHGWILGYDQNTLAITAAWNATPNSGLGGIWQSGGKIAVDPQGYFYFETGNGGFDTTLTPDGFPINGDYGDSFVKLAVDPSTAPTHQNVNGWGLKVVDFFTPFNQQMLSDEDLDLGSGAPAILPDSLGSAAHPHLLIGAAKQGMIYLIDRDNMGKFNPVKDDVVQEAQAIGFSFDTPAVFDDGTTARVYFVGAGDAGKAFTIADGAFSPTPQSQTPEYYIGFQGSTPSISANGTTNGIVWDIDYSAAVLRAYDASNYADEIYSSDQAANQRDALDSAVKFSVPTVADGHVYVGTKTALVIFGHPATAPTPPADLTAEPGGAQISLDWSTSPDATYYTVYRSTDPNGQDAAAIASFITDTNFVDATASPGKTYYYQVTACNGGGESDKSGTASSAAYLPGDATGDGVVDFADLLLLAQNYGSRTEVSYFTGDFNDDGVVDFKDLLILAQDFGRTEVI